MSKELEMLRVVKDLRDFSTYSFAVFDLKAILARLEAAERVCESAANYTIMAQSPGRSPYVRENSLRGSTSPWAELCEDVAAYRALDGKGDGDEQ